jgi:peptidoglycan/xylan/chitin deacetylase (PgdA/CDA1 family)
MKRPDPKKLLVDFLDLTGLAWLASPFYRTRGAILGLHRVIRQSETSLMPGNVITDELLEQMLVFLKRCGYDFVALDEIPERLRSSARRRFIAFTFDDGYLDNLTCALPLLSGFNAPFAVFAVTGLADRTVSPWWLLVEALLLARDEVVLKHPKSGTVHYHCPTVAEKTLAYRQVTRWGYVDPVQLTEILRQAYDQEGLSMSEVEDAVLSWEQLRSLSRNRLATIGIHGVRHLPLSILPDAEAKDEIVTAWQRLRSELGIDIRHIAYPFGEYRDHELRVAAGLGLCSGVTIRRGTLRSEHANRMLKLPRIMLGMSPHASSVRFLRVSLHGLWNTIANREQR